MGQYYSTTGAVEDRVDLSGTSLTLDATYVGRTIYTTSGSATTVTVPADADVTGVGFNVGDRIRLVQSGAGALTIAAGSGATVNTAGAGATPRQARAQYGELVLVKTAADTWRLGGDVKTS